MVSTGSRKILFVCTGNTCRSPMAEVMFREMTAKKGIGFIWSAASAGIFAPEGAMATPEALKVLEESGWDGSQHRARSLSEKLVQEADLILTMTAGHKARILDMYPAARDKVFTVKEYAGQRDDTDISDPFGRGMEAYRRTARELKENLEIIIRRLEEDSTGEDGKPVKVAVGSDHAAFELKRVVIQCLEELGWEYEDLGTYSTERCDYPDFGYKVAAAVAAGEYDRGILCCGTGIGMSIVANKVKGVRAALCHDTYSARLTRMHNDSNILCLGARVIGRGLARDIVETWLKTEFIGGRHSERLRKIAALEETGNIDGLCHQGRSLI